MLVFLIGMPGAGKTTLGAETARLLQFAFTDLDAAIEAAEGQPIPAIFSSQGEGYFREVEATVLRSVPVTADRVIATGGGTPCFKENMAWMQQHGLTVYLEVPVKVLAQRLAALQHLNRPLLHGNSAELAQKLTLTFSQRKQFYGQAQLPLPAENLTAGQLAQLLRQHLFGQ